MKVIKMREYLKRYVDNDLEFYLNAIGAILIVGPKWCGKTTSAEQHCNSTLKLQDKYKSENFLYLKNINPYKLLEGEKPRLIDEWQEAPELWDIIRNSVDEVGEDGLYILTGSTVVDKSKIMHSGAGRIHRLMMRPMSLYESKESNGKISIIELFKNPQLDIDGIESKLSIDDLFFAMCRGGWPASLNKKSKEAQLSVVYSYLDVVSNEDMSNIDDTQRDPNKVRFILQSYARNISTNVNNKKIIGDISKHYGKISEPTFYSYINALKKLFVIDNIGAWSPNIKSKTSIRAHEKKEFIDPSIAVAALNLNPEGLYENMIFTGYLFENLCIRDLSIYTYHEGGIISYYRDKSGLEVDCVIHLRNGDYALIEFKLGSKEEEKGAKNLIKMKNLIKKSGMKEPSFLAIVNGGQFAYTRKDGVKVIPIGCLR